MAMIHNLKEIVMMPMTAERYKLGVSRTSV
jgi:hypothetical protein